MANESNGGRADRPARSTNSDQNSTRPQKGGEAATTRFGMEDGDSTDTPATGVDPDRQSPEERDDSAGESTTGSLGAASGLQPSGTVPRGGPGTSIGSVGAGDGSTGNAPSGNARGDASD